MTFTLPHAIKGPLFALLAYAIFATHDVLVKALGATYSSFQIIFFSVLLGFPLVTVMLMRDPVSGTLRPVHPWWTALRTVAGVSALMGAFYAFSNLPLAQVYALIFAAPLIITVLSIPILGERVGAHRWAAVVAGLIGVLVVLRPWNADELTLGHAAALLTACGSATASVVVRKIGKDERPVVLLLYPMMTNFVLAGAMMPLVYQPMPLLHMGMAGGVALLAFLAGLLMIAAFRNGEAAVVAPMQYSQIIWAAIFGALLFGERPDTPTWIGAAIIIASGVYIVLRESLGGRSQTTPATAYRHRTDNVAVPRIAMLLRNQANRVPPGYQALAKRPPKQ
ncbi:S-adenosylmethionine uptake transporter [Palleronia salina]|uniref:S-adenosylmethionine uptake transporter n=1 Tax=Palleronia salina TaxID=313368 RepID=A0A1M6D5Q8_9RHOB|nr:DMT family transporter [Palleronia salina]SHI68547.1 S-adenosylmethionine uptake transporter [Palleronia salina]